MSGDFLFFIVDRKLFICCNLFYFMNKNKLALFLGMLCGDGYLTIRTKKKGYKSYSLEFCNSKINIINLFDNLFYSLFNVRGNFHLRIRDNRKQIYEFRSYSREIFDKIVSFGFPIGLKKYKLKIPEIIIKGDKNQKFNFLIGFLITDGHIRKNKIITFHSGSKIFLEEVSMLINDLFGVKRQIKEYIQKNKYYSYQLNLNKEVSQKILMPPSHNGIASVLRTEP